MSCPSFIIINSLILVKVGVILLTVSAFSSPPTKPSPCGRVRNIRSLQIPSQSKSAAQQSLKQSLSSSFTSTTTTCRLATALQSSAISSNEDLLPGITAIDEANDKINSLFKDLRASSYLRLFCVDILASCEYMPQELFECYSELCEVYPVDDELVPDNIRSVDLAESDLVIDGWARWDMPSNDYYDTEEFPEGYTGYDGSEVWNFIHTKICFDGYGYDSNHWKAGFNKAVSGLHSVISAQVARGIQEKIDAGEEFTPDEVWRDPKIEFDRRLSVNGETPQAMENLYFGYILLLSAVSKAKDKLLADCAAGIIDNESASVLQEILSHPVLESPDVQNCASKFQSLALQSTSDLWEARMRSRELLRIMNCVQCNKCRLHGKVSAMALSTALQIHLGDNGNGCDLSRIRRVEIASLLSGVYKFSQAVDFCQRMR